MIKVFESTNGRVLSFAGSHDINRTNFDVDYLSIAHASIQTLPRGLSVFFSNVTVYALKHIELKKVQRADFKEFTKLKVLDVFHVDIVEPPDDLLRGLRKLEVVRLESCKIRKIPGIFFFNQRSLKVVNLKENQLKKLSWTLFSNNQQLKILDLKKNPFQYIPIDIHKRFENIKKVSFDEHFWLVGSDHSSKDCEFDLFNYQHYTEQLKSCKEKVDKAKKGNRKLKIRPNLC